MALNNSRLKFLTDYPLNQAGKLVQSFKAGLEEAKQRDDFNRFFESYESSYALTLAYPDEIILETARSCGIETEGRKKIISSKRFFKKKGAIKIDSESLFRNKIESMLITASWVEKIRKDLGLEAVSQVWADKPAWYFQISNAAGVYHLEVANTDVRNINGSALHSSMLALKYYPFTQSPVFPLFSYEEQCFVKSKFFNSDNTPFYDYQEKIPKNLFNVAAIEYITDPEDALAVFTFESPDMMRIRFHDEAVQSYSLLKQNNRFAKSAVDRRVPGVQIGYPFFERLLCLYSYYSKSKPFRMIISYSPGFEYVYDKAGAFKCMDAPDIKIITVNVLYRSGNASLNTGLEEEIAKQIRHEKEEVISDRAFDCGHFHCANSEHTHLTPPDHRWWSLAEADYKSNLASSCGCA